jgi:hypothetical protein
MGMRCRGVMGGGGVRVCEVAGDGGGPPPSDGGGDDGGSNDGTAPGDGATTDATTD